VDIHDAGVAGGGVDPVNKIGGQVPHEAGQHQQVKGIGFYFFKKGRFGNGAGFNKFGNFFRICSPV
jgi:hypothetical protein